MTVTSSVAARSGSTSSRTVRSRRRRRHPHGFGKGSPEWWIANIKPGRVLFEVAGVNEELAREAMSRAIHKLPLKARIIKREEGDA